MFPFHREHKELKDSEKENNRKLQMLSWIQKRFESKDDNDDGPSRKIPGYLKEITVKVKDIKNNFEPIKKVIDKLGYCEYCKYYIGTSSNIRKIKNVSVIYGCCAVTKIRKAVKFNSKCAEWEPKEFYNQIIEWNIIKIFGNDPYYNPDVTDMIRYYDPHLDYITREDKKYNPTYYSETWDEY